MSDQFSDPNNHAPEALPDDLWGDEGLDAGSRTSLPAKRKEDALPAGAKERTPRMEEEKGIEINVPDFDRKEKSGGDDWDGGRSGPVHRLEVQEHVPRLLTPAGAAPPPERMVPRQVIEMPEPDQDQAFAGQKPPEGENWGKTATLPVRWMVVSGILIAILLICAAIFLPKLKWKNQGERDIPSYYSQIHVQENEAPVIAQGEKSLLTGVENDAKKAIHLLMTAKSPDDFLGVVRDRARVEPLIRARWKPRTDIPAGWQVPDESQWSINKTEDREYGLLEGLLPDVTPFRFFVVTEDKRTVLDWEASTGYCETPWEELLQGQGNGGVARGMVSPSEFYSFAYPEQDFQCFRLTSLDGESAVWVYPRRGTPQGEQLIALFVQSAIPREILGQYPVTIRLEKGPEGSMKNQWVVAEKLHMDWVKP